MKVQMQCKSSDMQNLLDMQIISSSRLMGRKGSPCTFIEKKKKEKRKKEKREKRKEKREKREERREKKEERRKKKKEKRKKKKGKRKKRKNGHT
jgi:hypothetical protein